MDSKPEPLSEEQLRACTIGELVPYSRKVVIVDYDPSWPTLYQREAERIERILGDRLISLEHVGSTSVPGLPTKPIIDMLLVVPDSSDEEPYLPLLENAGYVLRIREPDWFQHRLFKGPDTDINLHVFSEGCPEIKRMLDFRDWLRENTQDREFYAATKRKLAERNWKYVQNYADAKTPAIQEILQRANFF